MEYGNLAYKEYYTPKKPKKPQQNRADNKKQRLHNRNKALRYIAVIAVLSVAAGYMISTFVTVNETKADVARLKNDLADMQAQTSQKSFDLDHAIDLAEVEEIATTRLGMQRPEKYQMVYVNVSREDAVEKTAAETDGASKRFSDAVKAVWSNIVDFFSIK